MDEMEVDKPADEKGKDSSLLETAQTESKENMTSENSGQPMNMETEPDLNIAPILSQTEDELLNDSLDLESEMNTFLGVSLNSDDSTNEEEQQAKEITKELEKTKESEETNESEKTKESEETKESEKTKESEETNESEKIKELEETKESEITKDAEGSDQLLPADDKTETGSDTVLAGKHSVLSKMDKGDDIAKELMDEDSKLSDTANIIKSITDCAVNEGKESTVESIVKEATDKTKDTKNDLENKKPEEKEGKKEPVKQMVDFDDASMDGMNEGDALGLLAETEGRERHSSDPEDEDEEEREGNSDAESSDALSEAPEDSDSETTDEEYEPQDDEEEDDDEIDAQDEDGHHFRVVDHAAIDTPDENSFEGVELPIEHELDIDDESKIEHEIEEESMDIEESSDMVSILNVTSLATGDTIENGDMTFTEENDTDLNLEKDDNSQPVLIISSICSVDKSVIDQIVSATKEADAEAEADAEIEAALVESIGGDITPIETPVEIEAVTDIIEAIGLNAGVIKDIPVDAEEMEEFGSVVKALLNFETSEEPPKPEEVPLSSAEEAGSDGDSLAERSVYQSKEVVLEEIAITVEKTPEKAQLVEEKSTEMVDAISKDSETESNVEIFEIGVPLIVEKVLEVAVPETDDIQDVWDSLLNLEQNKNKRKADESLEKVSKKLDTKLMPSSANDDSLVEKEPSCETVRSFLDGPIFPESDETRDVMESSKLQDEFQLTLDHLQRGLDTVPETSIKSEVVKMEEENIPDEAVETVASEDVVISSSSQLLVEKDLTDRTTSLLELEASPSPSHSPSPSRSPSPSPSPSATDAEIAFATASEPIPSSVLEDSTNKKTSLDSSMGTVIKVEVEGDKKVKEEVVEESATEKVPDGIKVKSESVVDPKPAAEKSVQTISEVFSLDSDDEETVPEKTTAPLEAPEKTDKSAEPTTNVIVRSSKKPLEGKKCVNPACSQRGTDCPLFLPSLFRARDLKATPAACKDCLDSGVTLMEVLTTRLKMGLCLFDVEMPNNGDMVEISDSDSDSDVAPSKLSSAATKKPYSKTNYKPMINAGPVLDPKGVEFLTQNLDDVFSQTWSKLKIPEQLVMCENTLIKEMDMLNAQSIELGKMIDLEQVDLDRMRKCLYETFRPPTECRKEVLISDHGNTVVETSLMSERRSARARKFVVYDEVSKAAKRDEALRAVSPIITADGVINDSTVQDAATLKNKADLPPLGTLPDHDLKVGDTVYAVKQSIFGAWCPAKILQILPKGTLLANGTFSLFSLVRVRFITMTEAGRPNKQVTGRQLAYPDPAPVRYPMGTRVIALFKNTKQQLGGVQTSAYYSGVVAEVPLRANRYRYLVFSDDGYARYVSHCNVLFVCERSARVWEDVHPDSRDFVRKYLQGYPNQPMVRVEAGHSIRTEYSGKFWFSHVLAVDSSLALIKFSESSGAPVTREEWIYRGSTRLEPLFLELQAADRRAHGRHRASYATTNLVKNKNFPYVEYSRPEQAEWEENLPAMPAADDVPQLPEEPEQRPMEEEVREEEEPATNRSVARKSTAKGDHLLPPRSGHQLQADQVKSKVVYYSPKVSIRPAKLVPHTCGSSCLNRDALPLRDLRTYNPLARPLLSGWQRLILKYRGKRTIVYRAPCGRRLRSPQELHLYLRLTGSQMSVDLFDFDHWVHCLAEFVPTKCFVSKRDLSHGGEAVPVPCVNYYDHSLPEFSSYSTRRIPTQGVHLNLDEEFLCGCDCTDDCQDKSRCQCWQLTLEGAKVVRSQPDKVGYQYKRLLDPVPTGIYECNSRCKCAATCLNRVVQHPLQLKLQVFKTFNRGWGIRALNDVSRGTFLCIYAGNLLTDAVANVDGVNEGDEYLAELDYIEVVERLKENYESDVPTESESDENSEPEQRPSSNRDGKTGQHGESDEEFTPGTYIKKGKTGSLAESNRMRTRRQQRKDKDDSPRRSDKALMAIAAKETADKLQQQKAAAEANKPKVAVADRQSKDSDGTADGAAPVVDEFITISDDEETMREPSRFAAPEGLNDDEYLPRHRSVRSFFGKDEACYIMDAKVQGNLGRYLNHSCSPNVFVQNVFVDTHDPRFPWVAFFTLNHVRAGTELTWNYNYDVGSVPGKALYCGCGATNCRGRLL